MVAPKSSPAKRNSFRLGRNDGAVNVVPGNCHGALLIRGGACAPVKQLGQKHLSGSSSRVQVGNLSEDINVLIACLRIAQKIGNNFRGVVRIVDPGNIGKSDEKIVRSQGRVNAG